MSAARKSPDQKTILTKLVTAAHAGLMPWADALIRASGYARADERWTLTRAALAEILSVSVRTITRWQKSAKFPRPGANRKIDVRAVAAWYAAREGEAEEGGQTPEKRERTKLVMERRAMLRQQRLKDAGELHDVSTCEAAGLRKIHAVKAGLLQLARDLAPTVAEVSDKAETEKILTEHFRRLLSGFSGGVDVGTPESVTASPAKPKRKADRKNP